MNLLTVLLQVSSADSILKAASAPQKEFAMSYMDLAMKGGNEEIIALLRSIAPEDPEEAALAGLYKYANWLETGEYGLLEWQPTRGNGLLTLREL